MPSLIYAPSPTVLSNEESSCRMITDDPDDDTSTETRSATSEDAVKSAPGTSLFERLITTYPPVFDNVLQHIPTSAVFDLYHTSRTLRDFLQNYPTAWRNLSFRLLPPSPPFAGPYNASGFDSPDHVQDYNKRRFSLDLLLRSIQPFSGRLVRLELDNTSVSGTELHARVLEPRRSTLQHLSDYYAARHGTGPNEVWVPYDRLWRSQNYAGKLDDFAMNEIFATGRSNTRRPAECLWESQEHGYAGEALGSGETTLQESKDLPMHLRQSHRTFVDDFSCDECGERILERCEQCSVRMHCMACRKTLCASCAYDRPLRKKRRRNVAFTAPVIAPLAGTFTLQEAPLSYSRKRVQDPLWWAPGALRSPNLMSETSASDMSSDEEDGTDQNGVPSLYMFWCCQKPTFSNSGGIMYNGPLCGDNMRAAPLPRNKGFEDSAYPRMEVNKGTNKHSDEHDQDSSSAHTCEHLSHTPMCNRCEGSKCEMHTNTQQHDIVPLLEKPEEPSTSLWKRSMAPRNLCVSCYRSKGWRISCTNCRRPICIEHEVSTLRVRRCGFQDLHAHWSWIQKSRETLAKGKAVPQQMSEANLLLFYHKWRKIVSRMELQDKIRSEEGKWVPHSDDASRCESDNSQDSACPSSAKASESTTDLTRSTPIEPFSIDSLQSPQPLSRSNAPETRQRSRSLSALPKYIPPDTTETVTQKSLHPPPLWMGCARYFCHARNICGGTDFLQQCTRCKVNVCADCTNASAKQCRCQACTALRYLCPNCMTSDDVVRACEWEEEEAERQREQEMERLKELEKQAKVKQEWQDAQSERDASDELALGLAEFFGAVVGHL
ncbi:MAG: hypothetical protein M1828_006721 [Chrysothrix sp. TS-e1954]|nr:MAG: hypothetical protein M1828_006721 [Chrysothrix sp. TS-e1954]